ncbi:hypothetical protein BU25DRAFT_406379 [Macroventuria anomochaeta]|uniref:Uncharacterized protein n=1 Tax=Macroventuria anomochaeta TaxID=301207 RepID=A0ACB6SGH5_9PLEO|nr:uncharacterized protein BU25DRAFT_406379 [Macroventuria anomochaeta]KAF2633124.1 hypothetical protein BU25DRAFT_406379 [Macroventuria anomochaeta]
MAAQVPEYYLSRNWDYPPTPDGPIQIGNVISSLKEPHRPLATVKPDIGSLITSTKTGTSLREEKGRSGGLSFMTTFLGGLLPLSGDVGINGERSSGKYFTFNSLDTTYINTAGGDTDKGDQTKYQAYIDRCVRADGVIRYLDRTWFRKHVWVVTGIKVVRGGGISTTQSSTTDVALGVQADGTAISGGAVPVGGGPEVCAGRKSKFNVSWNGSTDFVLAYKVSKIKVDKLGKAKKEREYLKGAYLELTTADAESFELAVTPVDKPRPDVKCSTFTVAETEGENLVTLGIVEDSDDED